MLNKLIQILLIILFITLPLINSHLLDFFGLQEFAKQFYVKGNYEFTKVIYFNIFSGLILFLYFVKTVLSPLPQGRGLGGGIIFLIIFILIISTIFSISPQTSLLGNDDKAHSLVMFLNLIGIFIILINQDYSFKKSILFWTVLGLFPIIYFAGGEFINPSYKYGDLSNRAIGTFGHPNYLALYLLLFIPIITQNKAKLNRNINYFLLFGLVSAILLTKSVITISLLILYKIYYFLFKARFKHIKSVYFIIFLVGVLFIILENFGYSKLHSFLSRFYLWETTINIIKSDFKTILIGNGLETLGNVFEGFKSPFLYIFENIGFTADRPHNIFLNIFYHTGIFGLFILIYLIFKLLFKKHGTYKISLVLGLIFLCFNFASIASYLVIILFVSFLYKNTNKTSILNSFSFSGERGYIFNSIVIFLITSFSVFGAYISYNFFASETYLYNGDFINADKLYKKQVENFSCKNLEIKSAENYFLCGNSYWEIGKKQKAINYYNLGLKKLPDLWNKNSKYYDNILVKDNPDILHRFYSEKYSNLGEILNRVGIKNLEK